MFEFAWPWLFLILPLPLLLRYILPAAKQDTTALNVSFLKDLEAISGQRAHSKTTTWHTFLLPVIIWCLLVTAAARPQLIGDLLPVEPSGRDLLLAVDTSGSMEARDMDINGKAVDRLVLIKTLFGPFIDSRIGDRIGLILFGSDAYLQAPLTYDRNTVKTWLDESMIGIAGTQTAIGDAIALGVKQLYKKDEKSRVLVLITDGSNNSGRKTPEQALELAKQAKVKVYTIGIGSDKLINHGFMRVPASYDLNEDILKQIAEETGAQYFRARTGKDLLQISEALNKLEPVDQKIDQIRFIDEYYYWPLLLAMLLASLLLIKRLFPALRN